VILLLKYCYRYVPHYRCILSAAADTKMLTSNKHLPLFRTDTSQLAPVIPLISAG